MKKLLVSLFIIILVSCFPGQGAPSPTAESPEEGVFQSTLQELNLSGSLILIEYRKEGSQLMRLDLSTGEMRALFQAPERSILAAADVSPDGEQILLAYAPPPPEGQVQFGYTGLFLMPVDGSGSPEPLLERVGSGESFSHPTWSPDGKAVYYTHTLPDPSAEGGVAARIERLAAGSEPEIIVEDYMWPRLSMDGEWLAFLSINLERDENELFYARSDGSDLAPVFSPGEYPAVDAHVFSPDGQMIYFSAVNPVQASSPAWPSRGLPFGVKPVSAHDAASDWYRGDLKTGESRRLSYIDETGMYAAFSPAGDLLAVTGSNGVYIMQPDGSRLVQIAHLLATGTVDWIP